MPDPITVQPEGESGQEGQTVEPKELTVAELAVIVENQKTELINVKSAQAGETRTVSTLTDKLKLKDEELTKLRTSSMSPEEKADFEKTIAANTEEKYKSQIAALEKDKTIMKFLVDEELDPKLSEYLTADNPEDLKIQVASFQEIINKEVSKRLNQGIPGAAKVNTGKVDKAAYVAMTLDEQTAFYNLAPENPGLIRQWKQ